MLRHIYLVGFMGSGKSTVGPVLAVRLDRPFHDLDDLIELEQGISIGEIFALKGEPYFRALESRLLARTTQFPPCVIALGGGTFSSEFNRQIVARNGISVWLRIPLALAQERCRGLSTRPLAKNPEQFEALFRLRESHYRLAQASVEVESKSPTRIADEILARILPIDTA